MPLSIRFAVILLLVCCLTGCQQADNNEQASTQQATPANLDKLNMSEETPNPALAKLQGEEVTAPKTASAPSTPSKPTDEPAMVIEEQPRTAVSQPKESVAMPTPASHTVDSTPIKQPEQPTKKDVTAPQITSEPAQPVAPSKPDEAVTPVVPGPEVPQATPPTDAKPVETAPPAPVETTPITQPPAPIPAPLVTVPPAPVEKQPSADELLYKKFAKKVGEYEYKNLVEGEDCGKEKLVISQQDSDTLVVRFEFSTRVSRLWGAYTYTYNLSGSEVWKGAHLQTLQSATNDNGTKFTTNLRSDGTTISGQGKAGTVEAGHPATTGNIWNLYDIYQTLGKDTLILVDSESGKVATYKIFPLGEEMLTVAGSKIRCQHIKLGETAETNWEAWFSPAGVLIRQRDIVEGTKTEFLLQSWK